MPRKALCLGALLALWGLAAWMRVRGLGEASALGDAIHPWWAALREGWPRPHAPPYGWALVLPYKAALLGAPDLWGAVRRLALLHALAAPVAAWATWHLGERWPIALAVGVVVALDPGLLDTVSSGAEGYLAPLWIGLLLVGVTSAHRWGAPVALCAAAMAVMHHPLAICVVPLLAGLRWRERSTWAGVGLAVLLLAPRLLRLAIEPLPGGADLGGPAQALTAYMAQGGPVAAVVLAGPFVGLFSGRTRSMAIRTLAAFALLAAIGVLGGYLRDHHLRLLTLPALAGWAAVGWPWAVGVLGLLLVPWAGQDAAAHPERPGTLGLARILADRIEAEVAPPLVVDGAWISGGPAASPAALMLDLHLRGWTPAHLQPGHTIVVVVSGTREDIQSLDSGELRWLPGERHGLLVGPPGAVAQWSTRHCSARLGGAWDGLSVLHPALGVESSRGWWACP